VFEIWVRIFFKWFEVEKRYLRTLQALDCICVSDFLSRVKPMGLIVAPDDSGMAEGDLFWDDGESIGKKGFHGNNKIYMYTLLDCYYQQ